MIAQKTQSTMTPDVSMNGSYATTGAPTSIVVVPCDSQCDEMIVGGVPPSFVYVQSCVCMERVYHEKVIHRTYP